jgi:diguanylate cyclase (GGDEF)-like protein
VLLAGLVGGPLAGVLAGIGTGLGDVNAVWRRRSAYAGLAMLQGFAAGLAGEAWSAGRVPLAAAAGSAALAYLALSAAGLALVMLDRGSWNAGRLGRALALDVGEVTVSAPLVYLFATTFASAPGVTSLAVLSGLAVTVFGAWGITTERERRARLIDPLTGALTRTAFEEAFAREQARVLRGERRAGLIICDLDRFGELNERYGHLGGDHVLRSVVKRIEATLRPGSAVARWGGDELCLLVPGIGTLAELESLCERVRRSVAGDPLALGGAQVSVTISLGATLLADWTTWEQTFARADEALYQAKRTRDASCVLPPLAAGGGTATWQLAGA